METKFLVNVWAGVIGRTLKGIIFYQIFQIQSDIKISSQNDSYSGQYHVTVRKHLDSYFPIRWIGKTALASSVERLDPIDFYVEPRSYFIPKKWEELFEKKTDETFEKKSYMELRVYTSEVQIRACRCIKDQGSHFIHEQ